MKSVPRTAAVHPSVPRVPALFATGGGVSGASSGFSSDAVVCFVIHASLVVGGGAWWPC